MNTTQLEEKILGSLIAFPERIEAAEDNIRPQCFTDYRKNIYEALISLTEQQIPVDLITVYQELKKTEVAISPAQIPSAYDELVNPGTFARSLRLLYEKWLTREVARLSKTINQAIEGNKDPFEIIADLTERINALENNFDTKETTMVEDLAGLFEGIEKKMTGSEPAGLMSTTFPSFNRATGGIMNTDYVVVYGDYKMGKSTVSEQLALDIAFDYKAIGIFNLEMTKETLYQKALSMRTGIDYLKLRNPKGHGLTMREFNDMKAKAWELFRGTKIFVEDKIYDIDKIIARMRAWKKKHGIELFVIDYLGLLEGSNKYSARHLEMAGYSRRLKNFAKQIQTPIIVLSQANGENRTAESKGPARDADFVISVTKPFESGITSMKDRNGQNFPFTQDHFLVTMENSRHGKNKQNFVCSFINNNFEEVPVEYQTRGID